MWGCLYVFSPILSSNNRLGPNAYLLEIELLYHFQFRLVSIVPPEGTMSTLASNSVSIPDMGSSGIPAELGIYTRSVVCLHKASVGRLPAPGPAGLQSHLARVPNGN